MDKNDEIRNKRNFAEHMNKAKILLAKEDCVAASREAAAALEVFPEDPDARELTADILAALGKKDAAAAEYKKLFSEDKTRESAEEKYALLVLNQFTTEQKAKEEEEQKTEKKASPWTVILTAIVPGVGALLKEKYLKGGIILALWLVFFCLAARSSIGSKNPAESFTSLPSILAFAVWLYSFIDTVMNFNKK